MIKMKDSGYSYIGNIPENWEVTRNKNVFSCTKELVGNIRHDEAHGPLLSSAETAGGGIRRIAQLSDGLIDLLLSLLRDIAGIIDGVGHGGGGNTGQTGHITDRHFHSEFSLLRKYRHFCAIN